MQTYYQDLLAFGESRINDFFKETLLYENQFQYTDFNTSCFNYMYMDNDTRDIKPVKDLQDEIDELRKTCNKCKDFYMVKRNDSVKSNDIVFGNLLEDTLIDFLNSRFGLNTGHGDNEKKIYPDCRLMDKQRNTLAYFEIKYHSAPFILCEKKIGRPCYEGSVTLDLDKVRKQITQIKQETIVPVYYLHWIDYPCLKGIYFETADKVEMEIKSQDVAFERKDRTGDFVDLDPNKKKIGYTKKFYSRMLTMGTFDELINIFMELNSRKKIA